ncbi:MAG: GntR family transcriptional regulator [Treponema sp.]|nr:GntR family transcriptional regulator [Treponema sp.]
MTVQNQNSDSSVQNAVYTALKTSILTISLKPGTVISTQEIATKLQVSRTPVREAFIRLQRDGLVEMYPQKETVISKIDVQRVRQERFIRESLECAIIEKTIKHCKPNDIESFYTVIEKQKNIASQANQLDLISLDNDFHELLFTIGRQPMSWQTIMNISTHYTRIRVLSMVTPEITESTIQQHTHIIEAIKQKDVTASRSLLSAHLHQLESQIRDLVSQYPSYFEEETMSTADRFAMLLSN